MAKAGKGRQQTLEGQLGCERVKQTIRPPKSKSKTVSWKDSPDNPANSVNSTKPVNSTTPVNLPDSANLDNPMSATNPSPARSTRKRKQKQTQTRLPTSPAVMEPPLTMFMPASSSSHGQRKVTIEISSSSDDAEEDSFNDGEDERKAGRRPSRVKRGKAAKAGESGHGFFSQAHLSPDDDDDDDDDDGEEGVTSPPRAAVAIPSPAKPSARRTKQSKITDSPAVKNASASKQALLNADSDAGSDSLFRPKKTAVKSEKFNVTPNRQSKITDSLGSRGDRGSAPTVASSSKPIVIKVDSDDDSESSVAPKKNKSIYDAPKQPPSTDDDSDFPIKSMKQRGSAKSTNAPSSVKHLAPADDSDSDAVVLPSRQRATVKRQALTDDDDDDDDDDDADDDVVATPAARRHTKSTAIENPRKRAAPTDDSESDDVQPVKRRRFVRRADESTSATVSEAEPQQRTATPPRSSQAKTPASNKRRKDPKSEKKRQMELLRRRRAGEVIAEDDLTSEEEEEHVALYDSDPNNLVLSDFEDDDEGVLNPGGSSPTTKATEKKRDKKVDKKGKGKAVESDGEGPEGSSGGKSGDDNDASFIVDDPEGAIGVPDDLVDIPIEFTSHAHKPLKIYFKHAIEWLVLNKIYPGFAQRQDPVYMLAWNKLNYEVESLSSSKFVSSVWKPDFQHALKARPEFSATPKPASLMPDEDPCMACGRRGHPSTWVVTFSGAAYVKNSKHVHFLEEIEVASDDEDDSEPEGERDEDNNRLPPADKQWNMGATCKSNAETAHDLIHWKHSLALWVYDWLERQGYMTDQQLSKREKMKPSRKYKLVDEIMDKWETVPEEGGGRSTPMKALWHEFKRNRELAREKETTGRSRWARN